MQRDDDPVFDAAVTDLEGQPQRFFSSGPWRRGSVLVLLLVLLLAGGELAWAAKPLFLQRQTGQATPLPSVTVAPTATSPAVFASLAARPLHFPVVRSLATCPVSIGQRISPDLGLAAGTGPLYIVAVDANGNVDYVPSNQWGADQLGWGGMAKTLWAFPTTFAGPVLVRGQRLDSVGAVRFNAIGGQLLTQLQILVPIESSSPPYQVDGGWYIRFNAPGCYGLQMDWLHGTEQVFVRAEAGQGT